VDGDADVVFPDELLKPWQRFGSRISGDYYADAGALTVLELGADVGVFILGKVDGSGSVQLDAGSGVVARAFVSSAGSMGK